MRENKFIIILAIIFLLGSCKKEEVTNEYITNVNGPEIFTYTMESSGILIDIEQSTNNWNVDNNQMAVLEIGDLNEGDIVIAETQVRLRDQSPLCNSDISVYTGAALTMFPSDLPTNSAVNWGNGSTGWTEHWQSDETYVFFDRTSVAVIDSTYEDVYAGFWVNLVSSNCEGQEKLAQTGSMIISIYRN